MYFFHAVLCWEFSECLQAKIFTVLLYGKQKFSGKQQSTIKNRSIFVLKKQEEQQRNIYNPTRLSYKEYFNDIFNYARSHPKIYIDSTF